MSRKKIPSKKALIEALHEAKGNMAAVGRRFGVSRQRVSDVVRADPKLQQIVEEESEVVLDIAESQLFKLILEGQPAAIIFYLKTRGRERGYSERLELVPLKTQNIEVELGSPTDQIENGNTEALIGNGAAVALLEQ